MISLWRLLLLLLGNVWYNGVVLLFLHKSTSINASLDAYMRCILYRHVEFTPGLKSKCLCRCRQYVDMPPLSHSHCWARQSTYVCSAGETMQLGLFQKEPVSCCMHNTIAYQLIPYGPCKTLKTPYKGLFYSCFSLLAHLLLTCKTLKSHFASQSTEPHYF